MPTTRTTRPWQRAALLALFVPALIAPASGGGAPVGPFTFAIERNGKPIGFFQTCRGLGSTNEVIEFRDGADPSVVRKVPGRLSAGNVTCTRGVTPGPELETWRAQVEQGNIAAARSAAIVILYDATLQAVVQWNLDNAWPSELLALGTQTAAIETVTIVCERIQRVSP